ncbi:hypothetical protein RFI_35922 [Reticulomyxa filosa]|uniref:Uncharacterized protein n=1 Tax=Reticulomyxa filosa TaxID=46433 RepID=X6LHT4_RETFI|nr:hypothetical protein RFI_35922 [Reticulomyxa filosa]|eukprot:ETO01518.1 hypothetical protein RFI_35922 [Reticulomyxa filosa]
MLIEKKKKAMKVQRNAKEDKVNRASPKPSETVTMTCGKDEDRSKGEGDSSSGDMSNEKTEEEQSLLEKQRDSDSTCWKDRVLELAVEMMLEVCEKRQEKNNQKEEEDGNDDDDNDDDNDDEETRVDHYSCYCLADGTTHYNGMQTNGKRQYISLQK